MPSTPRASTLESVHSTPVDATSTPAVMALRRALSQFTTGITIMTTRSPEGAPVGITANSFSSVSLDPPLMLWSLSLHAGSVNIFRRCERYMVHVLAAHQLNLAKRFATRGADRFGPESGTAWQSNAAGLPQLEGCLAWFECVSRSQYEEGDHVILVGRIENFAAASGVPLAFHGGQYIADFTESPLPKVLQSPWGST